MGCSLFADVEWIAVVREFGVPIALLMIGFTAVLSGLATMWVGLSKVVRWIGAKIIEPLRDRIITFFDSLEARMGNQQSDLKEVRSSLERHDEWERGQADERAVKVSMQSALIADQADRIRTLEDEHTKLKKLLDDKGVHGT